MVIINKGIKGHNSEKMIGKVFEICTYEGSFPKEPKKRVMEVWDKGSMKKYQEEYKKLPGKERVRRDLKLHIHEFKSQAAYTKEYRLRCNYEDRKDFREWHEKENKESLAWDELCVLL